MSLSKKLLEKIQTDGTMTYGAMCQYTVELGYKVNTSERRLREHMEDGLVFPVWATSKRNTRYISAYTAKTTSEPKVGRSVTMVVNGETVRMQV